MDLISVLFPLELSPTTNTFTGLVAKYFWALPSNERKIVSKSSNWVGEPIVASIMWSTMFWWPLLIAKPRGVMPLLLDTFFASRSCFSKSFTSASWPTLAARWSGWLPSLFDRGTILFNPTALLCNIAAMLHEFSCLDIRAKCNGVFRARGISISGLPPFSRTNVMISVLLLQAEWWVIVHPSLSLWLRIVAGSGWCERTRANSLASPSWVAWISWSILGFRY